MSVDRLRPLIEQEVERQIAAHKIELRDLPIAALKRKLETDLVPDADTFLLPHSVGVDSLESPEPWIPISFVNGWANYGGAYGTSQYYKDVSGRVHIEGMSNGAGSTADTLFTLPLGYRPNKEMIFVVQTNGGAARYDLWANGEFRWTTGAPFTWVSLNTINFRAA